MTPKERVLAFYKHEMPDELPTMEGMHIVYDPNGIGERPPFGQTGLDWFGVKWHEQKGGGANTPDPSQKPILEDIFDWREVVQFPDLDAWDWDKCAEMDNLNAIDRENKMVNVMLMNGPFERLHMLMGFEEALCTLLLEPEELTEYLNAYMEWKCRLIEKVHEHYKPDILMFHDDWGTQKNMFFSPDTWRELIKPQIKKAVDKTHELGMFFELHSCGFMEQIVPEFVEIGIDSWQGQEINDIPKMKELTDGKLSFHTSPIYQDLAGMDVSGDLTEEYLRNRIRTSIEANAKDGNYMPMIVGGKTWWRAVMQEEADQYAKEVYA